jgi:EAL domain-containing protein (putative c-di-GMP-specific phosphodiesterase class I)
MGGRIRAVRLAHFALGGATTYLCACLGSSFGESIHVGGQGQPIERSLVIVAADTENRFAELLEIAASLGWTYDRANDAVRVEFGNGRRLRGISDLANFLRGIFDPARFAELRGVWIGEDDSLESQPDQLAQAVPLAEMVAVHRSPLLGILNRRAIETWYQPVFRRDTMQVWGYECLMRSTDKAGQLISPLQLLAWARQENLTFMLDRICRETHLVNAGFALGGRDCRVLLNFLPTAVYQPEFCLQSTIAAAGRTGLRPEQIIFQVVETEQMADRDHLRRILDHYRRLGFGVSLDDVGNGYSGLATHSELNPDLIKLDRELLCKAPHSDMHRKICALTVKLGRDKGKLVLAEGIETAEEHALAEEWGVDLVQGFRYGGPAREMALEPSAAAGAPDCERFDFACHTSGMERFYRRPQTSLLAAPRR